MKIRREEQKENCRCAARNSSLVMNGTRWKCKRAFLKPLLLDITKGGKSIFILKTTTKCNIPNWQSLSIKTNFCNATCTFYQIKLCISSYSKSYRTYIPQSFLLGQWPHNNIKHSFTTWSQTSIFRRTTTTTKVHTLLHTFGHTL